MHSFKIFCLLTIFLSSVYCECPYFQQFININDTSVTSFVGPVDIRGGRVDGIKDGIVAGTINKIAAHPTNSSIIYIGTPNGGIWKTQNAMSDIIIWKNLTSDLESLSVDALSFDYSDKTYQTLIAGVGYSSNHEGGLLTGFYITKDGGKTWETKRSSLEGKHISGIGLFGKAIIACSANYTHGGVFFSNDTGASFQRISSFPCTDLVSSDTNVGTFFAASLVGGVLEINAVTNKVMKVTPSQVLNKYEKIENVKVSYRKYQNEDVLYVGFLKKTVEGLWRASRLSGDWTWKEFNEPTTIEDGISYGLHPAELGAEYFSIVADPKSPSIVYLGGDHQPSKTEGGDWPNSIGANDHVGRLFKVDTQQNTFEAITNEKTKNNTAPHAYSRHAVFDKNGDLLEANNGGIYKLVFSENKGKHDWKSINGNLSISEINSVAYLGNKYYVSSTLSTGISYGVFNASWSTLTKDISSIVRSDISSDLSLVYRSLPYLKDFKATTFKFSTNPPTITNENRALRVNGQNYSLSDGVIPVGMHQNFVINRFSPNKLFFGISFDGMAYESTDGGHTLNQINIEADGNHKTIHSAVYGGMKGDKTILNSLIVATGEDFLAIRESSDSSFKIIESFPPPGIVETTAVDVAVNPENWEHIAVVFINGEVALSKNGGISWQLINPFNSNKECFSQKKIAIIPHKKDISILVGGKTGAFVYREKKNMWYRLSKWTNAFVHDLQYNYEQNRLWVGTLGHGIWDVENASEFINQEYFSVLPAPKPVPNYQRLTWIFAGFTTVLILGSVILVIALFRKGQTNYEELE